jgi:putative tryptophan/tyrosine transport system substrate-binding protein
VIARRTLLATAIAVTALGSARAQSRLPLLAILEPGPGLGVGSRAFVTRLQELGWVEGRTIRIEARFADWDLERLAAQAGEMAAATPRLIFTHSIPGLRAARAATATVPIVALSADMVAEGFVPSLSAPGGNITGVTTVQRALDAKRLELLHEVVPAMKRFGFLVPAGILPEHVADVERAAALRGVELVVAPVTGLEGIESAIDALAVERVEGMIVQNNASLSREIARVAAHALLRSLPAISEAPLFAQSGGLIQYGADIPAMFEQLAAQADKILRGARPAELPIEQPTHFRLIVNLRSAQALGLPIPQVLLARADEVIE